MGNSHLVYSVPTVQLVRAWQQTSPKHIRLILLASSDARSQPCMMMQVGGKPDFAEPVVLSHDRGGTAVENLCQQIHKTLVADFSYALVWGRSSKHYPQR